MSDVIKTMKVQIFFNAITEKIKTQIKEFALEHTSAIYGLTSSVEEDKPVVCATNLSIFINEFLREVQILGYLEQIKDDEGYEIYAYVTYDVIEDDENDYDIVRFNYYYNEKKITKTYHIQNNDMLVNDEGTFVSAINFELIEN